MRNRTNAYRVTVVKATGERYRRIMHAATGRDARIAAKRQTRKGEAVGAVEPMGMSRKG